jgi:hypothetical protein
MYFVPVMIKGFRVYSIDYVSAAAWFYAHNIGNGMG